MENSNENISTIGMEEWEKSMRSLSFTSRVSTEAIDEFVRITKHALQKHEEELEVRKKSFLAFLEGYNEGITEDTSTTKEIKLAKLSVLKDVKEFYK